MMKMADEAEGRGLGEGKVKRKTGEREKDGEWVVKGGGGGSR